MTKFITFRPEWEYKYSPHGSGSTCKSPEVQINEWLEANPKIEIISWQATPVGDHDELYITIQFKEN